MRLRRVAGSTMITPMARANRPESTNSRIALRPSATNGSLLHRRQPLASPSTHAEQSRCQHRSTAREEDGRARPQALVDREPQVPQRTQRKTDDPADDELPTPSAGLRSGASGRVHLPQHSRNGTEQRGRHRRQRAQQTLRVPSRAPQMSAHQRPIEPGPEVSVRRQVSGVPRLAPAPRASMRRRFR